jgi:hypothetical protein
MKCKSERSRSLPPPLVRAPGRLREPRHRPRAAARQLLKKVRSEPGREEGLHRVRRALRPRRALARVREGAGQAPHRRAALGRARARGRRRARQDEEARRESYERFADMFACASRGRRQGAAPGPVLHLGAPGLDARRHDRARAVPEEARACGRGRCRTSSPRRCRWPRACTTRASTRSRASPSTRRASLREKRMQKALLLYWDPAQHDLAREALIEGRPTRPHRLGRALPGAAGHWQGRAVDPHEEGLREARRSAAQGSPRRPRRRRRSQAAAVTGHCARGGTARASRDTTLGRRATLSSRHA